MYDGYTGDFNLVALWFDPYWNGGGSMKIYSYGRGEIICSKTQAVLPGLKKNKHQLIVEHKENSLIVFGNGNKNAHLPDMFLKQVKNSLFAFSRHKENGSGKKKDVFYLNNIKVRY